MTLYHTIQGDHSALMITAEYNESNETAELVTIEVLNHKETFPLPDEVIDEIGNTIMAMVDWSEIYADQNEIIEEEN